MSPAKLSDAGVRVNLDGVVRTALDLLGQPSIPRQRLLDLFPDLCAIDAHTLDDVATEALYARYAPRQDAEIRAYRRDESLVLPRPLDVSAIGGLSTEAREALSSGRPETLGQAARLPGVTPAAVLALMRYTRNCHAAEARRLTG